MSLPRGVVGWSAVCDSQIVAFSGHAHLLFLNVFDMCNNNGQMLLSLFYGNSMSL